MPKSEPLAHDRLDEWRASWDYEQPIPKSSKVHTALRSLRLALQSVGDIPLHDILERHEEHGVSEEERDLLNAAMPLYKKAKEGT